MCSSGWHSICLRYWYNSRTVGQHFNWYRSSRLSLGDRWASCYSVGSLCCLYSRLSWQLFSVSYSFCYGRLCMRLERVPCTAQHRQQRSWRRRRTVPLSTSPNDADGRARGEEDASTIRGTVLLSSPFEHRPTRSRYVAQRNFIQRRLR